MNAHLGRITTSAGLCLLLIHSALAGESTGETSEKVEGKAAFKQVVLRRRAPRLFEERARGEFIVSVPLAPPAEPLETKTQLETKRRHKTRRKLVSKRQQPPVARKPSSANTLFDATRIARGNTKASSSFSVRTPVGNRPSRSLSWPTPAPPKRVRPLPVVSKRDSSKGPKRISQAPKRESFKKSTVTKRISTNSARLNSAESNPAYPKSALANPNPFTTNPPKLYVSNSTSNVANFGSGGGCCPAGSSSAPATKPWKGLFFDNDFSYKNSPGAAHFFGEELKEIPLDCLGCESWISFGGEYRFRYMNENNRLRPGGPGRSTYNLHRWRNYVDFHYSSALRVYVEFIDASIFNEELPATGIDLNRWDILNAFVDIRIAQLNNRSVYLRAGRQELLYGAQRLVSPLDWSNTRRNFEGFKLFSPGESWDIDVWATHPVNTATGNGPLSLFDNGRDKADSSRYFSGAYAVYHGRKNQVFDAYWLWDRDSNVAMTGADRSRHTTGGRWLYHLPVYNDCGDPTRVWHAEIEGAYQFGHDTGQTVKAGFFTAGLGHTWKTVAWSPTLWLYYDWASGDRSATDNENNTFQQLFPLGHAYMGLIDNLARQNVSDINLNLTTHPTDKLMLSARMHWIDLANSNDRIYNGAAVAVGTPNSGDEIGEELDLLANYNVNSNFSVQMGYFWFWYGSAVTNGGLQRDDASQFYLQTTLRY